MAPHAVHERAVRIAGVRSDPTADKLAISGALTDARHNRAWLDDRAVATLFAEHTPELCPTDPIEKQQLLSAHALARLMESPTPAGRSYSEGVMVIDADAPEQTGPVAHWAIPVEVPPRVIAELADQRVVIVRNGVVLYRHCTIPGCRVAHDRCKLHHIVWWRHGGRTDLDNLLAICSVHHTRVAEVVEGEFVTIRRRAPSVVHPRHQFPFAW